MSLPIAIWSSSSSGTIGGNGLAVARQGRKKVVTNASLPGELVIGVAREAWSQVWRRMMEELGPSSSSKDGEYQRPASAFGGALPEVGDDSVGRYHLYASAVCPWAHRALIVHSVKCLSPVAVPISMALPGKSGYWEFDPALSPDKAHNSTRLIHVYRRNKGGFKGRATVPMLWDSLNQQVVNNESADIIQLLNSRFNCFSSRPQLNLAPDFLTSEMDSWNSRIYTNINNGVYRCGFAQSQRAYDAAVDAVFSTLDSIEQHLSTSTFLCGDRFTLADVRLFTTLFRFDAVYHILFKCSRRKISEFPNLYGYMRQIYQIPGVASTCNLEAIMDGYYGSLFPLNPGGIKPLIPSNMSPTALSTPHGRPDYRPQSVSAM